MNKNTQNLVLCAMFIALGLVLPFITGQIPQIGSALLPMHIPVILCGLLCGWKYGLICGFVTPLLRSAVFGMPVMIPMAVCMSLELAVYGLTAGFLYNSYRHKCIWSLYKALCASMIAGRIVFGLAMASVMALNGGTYTFQMFITGTIVSAVPGILLQLILIPAVMLALKKTHWMKGMEKQKKEADAHA